MKDYSFNGTTVFHTSSAQILTIATGSISALSSTLVIIFIARSRGKLSSSYHRIMLFMSFWDIVLSTAMALTSIPMPADDEERFYSFDGSSYGNTGTCTVQGYFYLVCSGLCVACNSALCIYYVCTIRYDMKERTVNKVLLPILLFMWMISTFIFQTFIAFKDLYNPNPLDPFCSYGPLPFDCNISQEQYNECTGSSSGREGEAESCEIEDDDMIVCIRGDPYLFQVTQILVAVFFGVNLLIIIVSMALILSKVYRDTSDGNQSTTALSSHNTADSDRNAGGPECEDSNDSPDIFVESVTEAQQRECEDSNDSPDIFVESVTEAQHREIHMSGSSASDSLSIDKREIEYTEEQIRLRKEIALQAIMYIGAFVLTWFFTLMPLFTASTKIFMESAPWVYLRLTFQPLQGFFNAIIFFYHKVYNVKQADDEIGWKKAIWITFSSPSSVPEMLVSDMEVMILDNFMMERDRLRIAMGSSPIASPVTARRRNTTLNRGSAKGLESDRSNSNVGANSESNVGASSSGNSNLSSSRSSLVNSSIASSEVLSEETRNSGAWSIGASGLSVASSHILSLGVIREEDEVEYV